MSANDIQVGGDHYKKGGEEHWDRIWRLYGRGYFVGCATKYLERYHEKNGKQDLEKAKHYIDKLIELEYPEDDNVLYALCCGQIQKEGEETHKESCPTHPTFFTRDNDKHVRSSDFCTWCKHPAGSHHPNCISSEATSGGYVDQD